MFRFLLLIATCQAWQHFLSFNDKCSAELSALKGTKMEGTISGGRLPYQFKLALQETLQKRVAAENCAASSTDMELFFGMNIANIVRFLDASDTKLGSTAHPSGCDTPFNFNWKKLKFDFPGVILPDTCRAAGALGFDTTKKCQLKFKLLDEFYIELAVTDSCTDVSQNGFGLPSIHVFCSGALCDSFARPCTSNTDCTGGATCDTIRESNLADALKPLVEMGLYTNETDDASCGTGGTFQQRFWSGLINRGAWLANLTQTVSTAIYSDVKLCGIQSFQTKFIPSEAPTPQETYRCNNGQLIPFSSVCDRTNNCANGEDEQRCGNYSCGAGMMDQNSGWQFTEPQCCPVCPGNNQQGPWCDTQYCSSNWGNSQGGGPDLFSVVCPDPGNGPISCPDFLLPSSTPIPNIVSQPLKSVSPQTPSQHIIGWSDCDGNVQIGSPAELAVLNGRMPFHNVAAQIEALIKTLEPCRVGTAPANVAAWARQFFPWSVPFWGGVFFSHQTATTIFNNVNPGVKVDDDLRYYESADNRTYICPPQGGYCAPSFYVDPPFADVANAPPTCNFATTTGGALSCELSANIASWFSGATFPAGWNGPTSLKFKFSSSCTADSLAPNAVPTGIATCEGNCDTTSKSGCCILRNAFAPQTVPGVCPSGYKLTEVNTQITDFLFKNESNSKSNDTTLQNFLSLVLGRYIKFGNGNAPFSDVKGSVAVRSICMLDGQEFDVNTEAWAKTVATENCPVPPTVPPTGVGCPQFLPASPVAGCGGANACLSDPVPVVCNPQCPLAPTPKYTGPGNGNGANPASVSVPFFGLIASLGAIALF